MAPTSISGVKANPGVRDRGPRSLQQAVLDVRRRRERCDAEQFELRGPRWRVVGREQRGLSALGMSDDGEAPGDLGEQLTSGADDVEDAARLGLSEQIRVGAGRAQALVVRHDDRPAAGQEGLEEDMRGLVDLVVLGEAAAHLLAVAGGRTAIGEPERAVRPAHDGVATWRRGEPGQRDDPAHADRRAVDRLRAVEHELVVGR
jgi:hypothetical protein